MRMDLQWCCGFLRNGPYKLKTLLGLVGPTTESAYDPERLHPPKENSNNYRTHIILISFRPAPLNF